MTDYTSEDMIPLPPISEQGRAMRALETDQMRRFVVAWLETGGLDNTRACIMAGYKGNPKTIRSQAHRLAHHPKILEAIKEESQRRLQSGSLMAVSELLLIAGDKKNKVPERLRALDMILKRTGFPEEQKLSVDARVEHNDNSDRALYENILRLAKMADLPLERLLGARDMKMIEQLPAGQPIDKLLEEAAPEFDPESF